MRRQLLISLAFISGVLDLHATVIVQEDFNRTGGLHNKNATIFSSLVSAAGGSNVWKARDGPTQFEADGNVSTTPTSPTDGGAYLTLGNYINNTKGSSAGIFDLQITIGDITNGAVRDTWTSIGFSTLNTPNINNDFAKTMGIATGLFRNSGEVTYLGGPEGDGRLFPSNAELNPGNGIPVTIRINLDVSTYDGVSDFGKVTYFLNGDSTSSGTYSYPQAYNFNSILISINDKSNGQLSGLSLSQPLLVIPEPSGLIAGLGCGMLLVIYRRRSDI